MKLRWLVTGLIGLVVGFAGVTMWRSRGSEILIDPSWKQEINTRVLEKYTIPNLSNRNYDTEIILDAEIATTSAYEAVKFHFNSDGKTVTGLAHIPIKCDTQNTCPVVAQLRGYAEVRGYVSGYGTQRSAQEYAKAGIISLAPDFLGYGDSASPSADVFEARFETYTTALNLLAGIKKWERGNGKVGLWGHSNGGHIALTILEISGEKYPTVVWAPVTAGFPYSILFYMDANEEGDKNLRKKLAEFEDIYNANEFNLLNYLEKINAPIQLHQGGGDVSVPVGWNRSLTAKLRKLQKEIEYFEYPEADHNLLPDWDKAVTRSIVFYNEEFGVDE